MLGSKRGAWGKTMQSVAVAGAGQIAGGMKRVSWKKRTFDGKLRQHPLNDLEANRRIFPAAGRWGIVPAAADIEWLDEATVANMIELAVEDIRSTLGLPMPVKILYPATDTLTISKMTDGLFFCYCDFFGVHVFC
jgi:hypothetical protein